MSIHLTDSRDAAAMRTDDAGGARSVGDGAALVVEGAVERPGPAHESIAPLRRGCLAGGGRRRVGAQPSGGCGTRGGDLDALEEDEGGERDGEEESHVAS